MVTIHRSEARDVWSASAIEFTSAVVHIAIYFWNSDTSIQKSHEGLFRLILCTLLDKYHSLLPVMFPRLFWAIPDQEVLSTFGELKQAISHLNAVQDSRLKICLPFMDFMSMLGTCLAVPRNLTVQSQSQSSLPSPTDSRPRMSWSVPAS